MSEPNIKDFVNEELIKKITLDEQTIYTQAQFLYMTESYGVRVDEKTIAPYFPEEEMRTDLFWHHKQERLHENGFKAFLLKHQQSVELPEKYQSVFNTYGKFYEQFVDLRTLLPGQQYFTDANLYGYYIFLEYEENFGGSSYLVLADALQEADKFPDLQLILRTFSRDEFAHARYAQKWAERLASRMTSMADVKARGQLQKILSQIKRQAMPFFYQNYLKKVVG